MIFTEEEKQAIATIESKEKHPDKKDSLSRHTEIVFLLGLVRRLADRVAKSDRPV